MPASDHAARDRALFNEIAASYCAKDLWPSSRVARQQRLRQTLRCLPVTGDIALLEVGCGAGFTANYLDGMYREYVGVDYSEELIGYAREHHERPGVSFAAMDINAFQSEVGFDVALMIGVLHHMDDLQGTLSTISALLKPGGWIVANEPQPANLLIHAARNVRKKVDSKYSSDQVELTSAQLRDALTGAGFEDVRLVPQGILSTPFAEVPLKPAMLWGPAASAACAADRVIEAAAGPALAALSWNLIAAGRKPQSAA